MEAFRMRKITKYQYDKITAHKRYRQYILSSFSAKKQRKQYKKSQYRKDIFEEIGSIHNHLVLLIRNVHHRREGDGKNQGGKHRRWRLFCKRIAPRTVGTPFITSTLINFSSLPKCLSFLDHFHPYCCEHPFCENHTIKDFFHACICFEEEKTKAAESAANITAAKAVRKVNMIRIHKPGRTIPVSLI